MSTTTSDMPPHDAIRRIFRADTPHDVICACIVAETLPRGIDVLALSADKAYGDRPEFVACMKQVASMHPWSAMIDITGLPMNRHWTVPGAQFSRWTRLNDTIASMSFLRDRLAPAFDLAPASRGLKGKLEAKVDEVYLTCLNQPDVQAFHTLFPSARTVYTPHGFDSMHSLEDFCYESFCATKTGATAGLVRTLADGVKGLVWGRDAVPVRSLTIDTAYSFNIAASWARENIDLSAWLNQEAMRRLFGGLDPNVRDYYERQAARCRGKTVVLLLSTGDFGPKFPYEAELDGYADLAERMIAEEGADHVLVKPHPRNSDEWVSRSLDRIRGRLSDVDVIAIEEHRFHPIELVLAPFEVVACGGIGSSSLRTLRKIYGLRAYCPESLILKLFTYDARRLETMKVWLSDNRDVFVAV